jgi:RNA polymerase sigma-70 factor (ECF subfamily)
MDEPPRLPAHTDSVTSTDPSLRGDERQVEAELDDVLRLPADVQLAEAVLAELQLTEVVKASGFSGPQWSVVEDALIDYGYQLMTKLLGTGVIFQRCSEHGLRLCSADIPPVEQDDLAQETVVEALRVFKDSFAKGKGWDPTGGANLRTFFARGLLLQFANIWRKRLRSKPVGSEITLDELADLPAADLGPHEAFVQRDEIRRGLADVSSKRTRAALVLTADGYEQEEIADILGVTPRAVEGYLRRHRKRAQQATEDGER